MEVSLDDECTKEQRDTIYAAKSLAFQKAYAASSDMYRMYERVKGSDGQYHTVFRPHPRYERWFGVHDDSIMRDEEGFTESDNGHAYYTASRVWEHILGGPSQKLIPKCGCPGYPATTAAWSEVDTKYAVHFCDLFFKLPDVGWPDSRPGTIVHEFTHFNGEYSGTQDYEYGLKKVEDLAVRERWKAVRNASSFEYYIMDTTPYDERVADPVEGEHPLPRTTASP
ncbi:hypothetical protein VI08_05570 [Luteibacter yeojuensis]|uniref:Lysine-specific metallo-endopeptidase domain-containing protein n=1 Tax=Luteibacter yeojuensis TaxID=345309 RepID=A0A0F3KYM0_9GAMM|nr:hypothetical protein VI08_05570 [Luteibacter yeojuensis]